MDNSDNNPSQPHPFTCIQEFAQGFVWAIGYSSHIRASFRKHRHEQPLWTL